MNLDYEFKYRYIGIIVVIAAFAGLFAFNYLVLDSDTVEFEANASVEDMNTSSSVGVVTGSNLDFGKVPEGSEVRKNLDLASSSLVMIRFKSTGNISEMLNYQRSILLTNQTEVEVAFNATEPGYYSGELTAKILKPNGEIGQRWLEFRSRSGI